MRSRWKLPYINSILFSKNLRNSKLIKSIFLRNSSIPQGFEKCKFSVHNGIWFLTVNMRADMVGKKFGEFAFTRRTGKKILQEDRKVKYRKKK